MVVRLAKHLDAMSEVQFLNERLRSGLPYFDEPAVEARDLRNILEKDASLRVLDSSLAAKLKARLAEVENNAA
jgi:hypothetical protein